MDFEKLKTVLGKRLKRLSSAAYSLQDATDQGPLEFHLHDDSYLVLETAGDGQSVSYSLDPLPFSDQGDGYIAWNRSTIDQPALLGLQLSRIDAAYESTEKNRYIAAWRIWFGSNFVCYANNGDNSEIFFNKTPEWLGDYWHVVATISHA